MTEHMFRLLERQQKLDGLLAMARARRVTDPIEIAWLRQRKDRLRGRLARLLSPRQFGMTSL